MVTTPANTAIAAPQSTSWAVGTGILDKLDVVIPDGHVGLTGIQLLWGGRQAAPYEGAEWITGNDDEVTVDLDLFTGTGTLVVRTYNTDDTFGHSHHLRAYLSDLERPEALFAPGLPFAPGAFPEELPPLVQVPTGELGPEEELLVATVFDQFLADLSSILDGFLSSLQTTLSGTVPEVGEEPPPEEVSPPPPTGAQDGEDHHHHKHGSGPHSPTLSHKRSPAHPRHHHFVARDAERSEHHLHVHAHVDGTRH